MQIHNLKQKGGKGMGYIQAKKSYIVKHTFKVQKHVQRCDE